MRVVVTSGPSYEPLDKVRRLSNFSTGELGTLLAESFAEAGHTVLCFRGITSTFAAPLWPVEVVPFATNTDLEESLLRMQARDEVNLVFHTAALCDFRVANIVSEKGEPTERDKISSRDGALTLTLEPVPKLIASMRRMFPASIIVGWKHELDGTPDKIKALGRRQMEECLTDACVLNGAAYGSGFGLIARAGEQAHLPDKAALCRYLVEWTEKLPMALAAPRQESFHALSSFTTSLSPFI
jgi:phosphopantothenoylcysteine decarboxylase/phosphopantothenate--cysteine ligase